MTMVGDPSELEHLRARLGRVTAELASAREEQAATAGIVRALASTPDAVQRVLDDVVAAAARLLASETVTIQQVRDGRFHTVAYHGAGAERMILTLRQAGSRGPSLSRDSVSGRAMLDRQVVHVPDCVAAVEGEFPAIRDVVDIGGARAQLAVPLLRSDRALGVLSVLRFEPGPFTDEQIRLLTAFADQAVIAIENARLFQEAERRNAELQESNRQVTEALERQTATADVLRIIASSPTALDRVFEALTERARPLRWGRRCGLPSGRGRPANRGLCRVRT